MLTQKFLLRSLINVMAAEMKKYDFNPAFKEQGFIRKDTNATYLYQFLVFDRTELKSGRKLFLVEPLILINVNTIEKFYKRITINKFLKSDIDFITIGNSIAALKSNKNEVYEKLNSSLELFVLEESDIPKLAKILFKEFIEVAYPYCLKNGNVAMVDKLLNNNPDIHKVHVQNDNYRILKGLIAAKLNHNPAFEKILNSYEKQISNRPEYFKTEWKNLNEILHEISNN